MSAPRFGYRPLTSSEREEIAQGIADRPDVVIKYQDLETFLGKAPSLSLALAVFAVAEFWYWKGRRDGAILAEEGLAALEKRGEGE